MFRLLFDFLIFTLVFSECPNGSFEWQTNCFYFQSKGTGFASAEAFCVKNSGHLVSIHDGFTNALLAQEASTYFPGSTVTDFWIGLSDLMFPGNWTWTDGTTFDFSELPPNSSISGQDCVALSITDGKWKADDCFKTKPFVCSTEKTQPTTTSYPAYVNCSGPYVYFQPTHSCYGVISNEGGLSWYDAEKYCIENGGHLASIHSWVEENMLLSFVYFAWSSAWVGAFSNDDGETWKWSDETPWDYNSWRPGLNHNFTGCGRLDSTGEYCTTCGIYVADCTIEARIICQIKL